jgi:hypothetical protein
MTHWLAQMSRIAGKRMPVARGAFNAQVKIFKEL